MILEYLEAARLHAGSPALVQKYIDLAVAELQPLPAEAENDDVAADASSDDPVVAFNGTYDDATTE